MNAGGGKSKNPGDAGDAWWDQVKKTVKPLPKAHGRPASSDGKAAEKSSVAVKPKPAKRHVLPPAPAVHAPPLPPLAILDRRARSRIARGQTEIGGRLDLHGYKLAEAKGRLLHFLEQAQSREKSLVLVITGKGTVAAPGGERGVMKREVPLWLAQPAFRALVIGFEEASPSHGGAGALYVRVRRKR